MLLQLHTKDKKKREKDPRQLDTGYRPCGRLWGCTLPHSTHESFGVVWGGRPKPWSILTSTLVLWRKFYVPALPPAPPGTPLYQTITTFTSCLCAFSSSDSYVLSSFFVSRGSTVSSGPLPVPGVPGLARPCVRARLLGRNVRWCPGWVERGAGRRQLAVSLEVVSLRLETLQLFICRVYAEYGGR